MITIQLQRIYHHRGVNGILRINGDIVCYTIELPWLDNRQNASCIPEGRYQLLARKSKNNGNHLWLQNVPDRSLILIHPANNAARELRGCIAPVSALTGQGEGEASKAAMRKLLAQVTPFLKAEQEVWLQIETLPVTIARIFNDINK